MTTLAPPSVPSSGLEPVTNPYAGPRPLDGVHTLYGRVREVREVRGLLIAHRIVLLYSPSGAGKTSLVEARGGLRGQLEDRGFVVPRAIRVGYQLDQSVDDVGVNRYGASVINSLASDADVQATAVSAAGPGTTLEEYLPRLAEAHPDKQLALIFDQFEELFTLDAADHDEKWAFLQDLGRALEHPEICALFAMREDFIAELDPFLRAFPTGLQTRFRLGLLGPKAAEQAALGPCNVADAPVEFDPEAVEEVVAQLRKVNVERRGEKVTADGPSVEPLQLQLVCRRLWANAMHNGTERISPSDLKEGGVDAALEDYYVEQIRATVDDKRTDVRERKLRMWFGKDLITEDGFRKQVRNAPGNGEVVLQRLVGAYILRVDPGRGLDWYELAHDRFVDPIRRSNREFERQWTAKWRRVAFGAIAILLIAAIVIAAMMSRGDGSQLTATRVDVPSETELPVGAAPSERLRFEPAVGDVVEVTLRFGAQGTPEKADLKLWGVTSDQDGERYGDLLAAAVLVPGARDATSGQRSAVLRHTVTAAGSLVVEVAPTDKVAFEVSIDRIDSAPATVLELGQRVDGRVEHSGDIATHVVGADDIQHVTIEVVPTGPGKDGFDPILSIADPDGYSGSADSHGLGAPESRTVTLEPGVEYAVSVAGFEGTVGTYEINVELVDADDGGNIAAPGDVSEHQLNVPAGGGLQVEVFPLDGFDPVLDVYDESGLVATADARGEADPETLLVPLTTGGEYRIEVSGYEDSTGSYLLTYDTVPLASLAVGTTARGEITGPNVAEYFLLERTSSGVGVIEVVPAAGLDVVLEVTTALGPFVIDGDGPDGIERFDFQELIADYEVETDDEFLAFLYADGASIVAVSGFDGSTGAYEVSAARPGR